MKVRTRIYERRGLLSALDTINLIINIGKYTIAVIILVVLISNNDKKNNQTLTLAG
ncbi:putative holin-like toxin [Vagococcus proximus]|uniref:putative holin-like toxin n=1 Tax=Vagococcus proximus TaxID=2991417 RepID=UPI003461DF7A